MSSPSKNNYPEVSGDTRIKMSAQEKRKPGRPRKYPKKEQHAKIGGVVDSPNIKDAVAEMMYSHPQTVKKIITFLSTLHNAETVGVEFSPEGVRLRAKNVAGHRSRITDNLFVEVQFAGKHLNSYYYDRELLGESLVFQVPMASLAERISRKNGPEFSCFYMYVLRDTMDKQLEIRFDWKFHNKLYNKTPPLKFSRFSPLDWSSVPEYSDSYSISCVLECNLLRGIYTSANAAGAKEIKFLKYNSDPLEISYESAQSGEWKNYCEDEKSICLQIPGSENVIEHTIKTTTMQCLLQGMLGAQVHLSLWDDNLRASASLTEGAIRITILKSIPDEY